ncbi:hypothetical protein CSX12_11015 [Microbacterium sp. Y-01]|uniref:hypothetical protein n=1 Tax=Microbacterium sp. Y-01 TaxID=2048898 RepID=UPI000F600705|nr:hypothetical protein [Microbacterium sp. Y-01]AZH78957.1 hypothetical protein CSX12_11015 [Microbacterium sp. Y-01]
MAKVDTGGTFPDLPQMPPLPHLRPQNATASQILAECKSIVRAVRRSIHDVEHSARPGPQLASIRAAVVDIRRVTFVLQTLSSRVEGFGDWYAPIQDSLRADPLMRYFVDLRNETEKRGLPGAIAELYNLETGAAVADVACFEDQYGLAVSGALRPDVDLPDGELSGSYNLRSFRLPDPPRSHRGIELTDLRFATLAELAVSSLETQVVGPAVARFGTSTE